MERFDTIVIGGGMAGLSTAAFLGLTGQTTIVLEKHDKVGGLASSFTRGAASFDLGIEGIRELAPDSFLVPFLRWWDVDLPMDARPESLAIFTGQGCYLIRGESARDDLRAAFPGQLRRIDRFMELNSRIVQEMTGSGKPKAPYEMSTLEKLAFGISSLSRRPNLLRYGLRNSSKVLASLFGESDLVRVAASKTLEDMVYLGVAHRWEGIQSGKIMYPRGGIGALPEAVAASIERRGGTVRVSAELISIRQTPNGYHAVDSKGREYESRSAVVAAPMPWAVFSLFKDDPRFDAIRAGIQKRRAFPGCFMAFATLDPSFKLGGANTIVDWGDEQGIPALWQTRASGRDMNPETVPIAIVAGGPPTRGCDPVPITVTAMLGWNFESRWGTKRGMDLASDVPWNESFDDYRTAEKYAEIKRNVTEILLTRLERRLGPGFKTALRSCVPATPLTFARYTNNTGGSYLGFSIKAGEYGKFFPQKSPLPGLFFAGQWVFPGFGVAGVSASGYFAAKALLAERGIDLDSRLAALG